MIVSQLFLMKQDHNNI